MPKPHDTVTDHALIRYLERVYGVDVSRLKRRIAKITEEGRAHKAQAINADGVNYVLSKSGHVVTVRGTQSPLSKRALRWKKKRQ